jgi:tRNA(Ile)-lysidine synthetase-like protein
LEVAARQIRYSALEEMAAAANCRWILTAHTRDDSAETVWMRMQSGAPWHEWTGIPRQRGPILRPLLPVTREELREWVSTVGIAYAEDETNADQSLRRNRTRAEMAGRREIWDLTRKQELARLGQMLGQSLELQRALALSLPIRVSEGDLGGSVGLAIDRIFIYFKGLTFIPIEAMWADLSGNRAQRLDSTHRRQIMSVLAGKGPQSLLALPGGIRLIRRGNVAWVVKRENLPVCRPVGEGTWPVPELDGCLTIQRDQSCSGTRLATGFENRPLWLRTWRAGDRIKFRRRPEKLISDLLNEAHLDPATRESTLVLADDMGPIMICGGPVAERALPEIDEPNSLLVTWMTNGGNPDQNQACS